MNTISKVHELNRLSNQGDIYCKETDNRIPAQTIEILARSFFREGLLYGFQLWDYVRFVNMLLKNSMEDDWNLPSLTEKENKEEGKSTEEVKCIDNNLSSSQLPLNGRRINIRAFAKDLDMHLFEKWLEDKNGRHFLMSRSTAQETTLNNLVENKSNIFGMVTLPDNTPIGLVAFLNHDVLQRKTELRKLIGDPMMRGKGFAKEATKRWIQYGISKLGLRKIYLNTLDTNIRNIKLNEELGFKMEGILRNEIFFDDKSHDVLRMGLCV